MFALTASAKSSPTARKTKTARLMQTAEVSHVYLLSISRRQGTSCLFPHDRVPFLHGRVPLSPHFHMVIGYLLPFSQVMTTLISISTAEDCQFPQDREPLSVSTGKGTSCPFPQLWVPVHFIFKC
jgi:hypothetical protein